MKVNKKEKIYRTIFVILLISPLINLCLSAFFIPIFLTIPISYMDGGSIEFYGIGYKVLKCNTLGGDTSVHFGFYDMKYKCNTNIIKGTVKKYNKSKNVYEEIKKIDDDETITQIQNLNKNSEDYPHTVAGMADFIINLSYKNIIDLEQYSIYFYDDSSNAIIIYETETEQIIYKASEENTIILKQILNN